MKQLLLSMGAAIVFGIPSVAFPGLLEDAAKKFNHDTAVSRSVTHDTSEARTRYTIPVLAAKTTIVPYRHLFAIQVPSAAG